MTAKLMIGFSSTGSPFWKCSECSRTFDVEAWGVEHLKATHPESHQTPTQAAELSQLKAEMERAIWEARREGYVAALEDVTDLLEQRKADGDASWSTTEVLGFVAQRIDDSRDERVEKPWLRA